MVREYDSLLEHCQVLASESPLLAIETFRETIDTLDFDALYENEEIREQIYDKVRIAMRHDDTQQEIGKLRTPHRIVGDYVTDCSFFDWFRTNEVTETFKVSPYRIHLFVIRDSDYSLIQIRNLLELVYSNKRSRIGIFIPLIYTTMETLYKMLQNLNSKTEQSLFLSTAEQIKLFDCVFQFSVVVLNQNYYLGRYTTPLLTFQKFQNSERFQKLCLSFSIGKSDNDLELLKVVFNSLISDIFDNVKLSASYVSEMTYEFVNKYLSNELDYDVNEFENAQRFAVCNLVNPPNVGKSSAFILHLVFIRTNFVQVINFLKIIWLVVGAPVFYLLNMLNLGKQTLLTMEEEYIFVQILVQDPNLKDYLSNIFIEIIKIYDMHGDTVNLSIEHLINVRGFIELLRWVEDLTQTITSTYIYFKNSIPINFSAEQEQETFHLDFQTRKEVAKNIIESESVIPSNIKQKLAELVVLDANQMTSQNDEQYLYERYSYIQQKMISAIRTMLKSMVCIYYRFHAGAY